MSKIAAFNKILKMLSGGKKANNDQLSYKKLHKMIITKHPTDPDTLDKLSLDDSVTLRDYGVKMADTCGCYKLFMICLKCYKKCKSLVRPKRSKDLIKPETMKDVPDSASDSDANDTYKGLSNTAIYLGEGAVMYL